MNPNRDKFSSIISQYLEYIYKLLLDDYIKKHNLKLRTELWYFLSLGIFSVLILIFGISILIPVGFFFGALLLLLVDNNKYLRRKILPNEIERVKDFDYKNASPNLLRAYLRASYAETPNPTPPNPNRRTERSTL